MLLVVYSILVLFYWSFLTIYLLVNGRKIKYLSSIEPATNFPGSSVVIIIPVRNEEYALKKALASVCNLDYGNYKILVVNDRSTDNTGIILSEMQAQYKNLSVINIETVPPGWLGKNFALYNGSKSSDEEYILFTDADVVYEKDALKKAMNYCLKNDLDHLTILPGMISSSTWLNSVIMTFVIMLTAIQRPWAVKLKKSKASMGVGAFNLVKREAYLHAGTHQAIAMRPDDDLQLAALLKAAGGKADVLYGQGKIKVEWYATVKEFINGLMKNIFSGFKYNVFLAAGGAIGTLLLFVFPLPVILIFGNNAERILVVCMLLFQLILYGNMQGSNGKWWYGFLSLYGGLIITYVIVKATITNLRNGGIYWRDTFYSLAELRRNK
ncbi:MAG: glycosyltransferase family 2 protein [Bacteroidota bacterium]|nr:glycosyltransferase family 2 protein [Bacteroidota bacterium]